MAVGTNLTLVEDMEGGGPTLTNWPSGGQGAANDTDLFFLGAAASSKKVTGETKGFWMNPGTAFNLSGTGQHVKFYVACTTPGSWTGFKVGLGSVANSAYEDHTIDLATFYPDQAGWLPVWVEVDAGTNTGSPSFSAIDEFGVQATMNAIGSNLKNFLCDQIHHGTRPALTWTGTAGDLDDFITSEGTNGYGVFILRSGAYVCRANFELGSATATTFDMDGKVILFPDAPWLPAASTWMGIDVDLQNASTAISAAGATVASGDPTNNAARKPDLIVSGTAGTLDLSGAVLDGLRVATLTSGVDAQNCVVKNSGSVTCSSAADLRGAVFSNHEAAADSSYLIWDLNVDPSGKLDNMTFTKGTTATHAIEFGANIPSTINLVGMTFTGYNASNGQNDSALNFKDTTGTITVNYSGAAPSYKTAGATITLVQTNTLTVTVDQDTTTEIRILDAGTSTVIAGIENIGATKSYSTGINATLYPSVDIVALSLAYENQRKDSFSMVGGDKTADFQQRTDRQFENPT